MLHIIAWLGAYVAILLSLGRIAGRWREARWFKCAFFPATCIALGVQSFAAYLCIGGLVKTSPIRGGEPLFAVKRGQVPCFAGALFLVISHSLVYLLFVLTVGQLERMDLIDAQLICLPSIYPYDILDGHIEVHMRGYFRSVSHWLSDVQERPWCYLGVLYVFAPTFASLRIRGREVFWALLVVVVLGLAVYFADWLGIGFPMMSRGWWVSLFHFPEWWAVFSFYVTTALIALGGLTMLRGVEALKESVGKSSGGGSPPAAKKKTSKGATGKRGSGSKNRKEGKTCRKRELVEA